MFLTAKSQLKNQPRRIVSLVPSQTELLYHLGLEEQVCGITKFCVHPTAWLWRKTTVGGTKKLNKFRIEQMHPELILANKEENNKADIEYLAQNFPVLVTDVYNLPTALQMITDVGKFTHTTAKAEALIKQISQQFAQLKPLATPIPTAYMIWQNPYMVAGGDTFINAMLNRCGFQNIFAQQHRYPKIEIDSLNELGCQLLLLSSEPYPFKEKHIAELAAQLPNTRILLANGEFFSWYGSRLLKAPAYFQRLMEKLG